MARLNKMGQQVKRRTARDKDYKIHNVFEHKYKVKFDDKKASKSTVPQNLSVQKRTVKRAPTKTTYFEDLQEKLGKNLTAEQYAFSPKNHLQFTPTQIQNLINAQVLRENPTDIDCTEFIIKKQGELGEQALNEYEFQSANYAAELRAANLKKMFEENE